MSSVVIAGNTSGSITLQAPAASGSTVLTLPAVSGTVITNTAGVVTQAMLSTNVAGNGPAFSAYASAVQSLVNGSPTKIALNTEVFDTNSNFDNTTNYRFTPTVAGYYFVSGVVFAANNTTGAGIYASILKNGICVATASSTANPSMYSGATVTSVIYFNGSTDYIELFGSSAGGTYTTAPTVYATGDGCRLSAFLARSA